MKSKRFRLLFIGMCVALAAGIALQAYWLNRAVKIELEKFDRDVKSALADAAGKIETNQTSIILSSALGIGFIDSAIAGKTHPDASANFTFSQRIEKRFQPNQDSAAFAMVINSTDELIPDTVHQVTSERHKDILSGAVKNVIVRLVNGDSLSFVPPPKAAEIEKQVTAALSSRGINIPYEYVLTNKNKPILASVNGNPGQLKSSPYKIPVMRGDIMLQPDMLSISFGSEGKHIAGVLWPQFLLSFFITAALVMVFFFTFREMLRQKKLSDIRNDFINNMTHEFKTPIATISLAADTAMNENIIRDPVKLRHYLELVKQENKRMNEHVEKVLEAALAERGELRIHREAVSVIQLVRRIADSFRLQADARNGIITIDSVEDYTCSIDSFHFEKALSNLIDNALKYTPEKPDVRISVRKSGQQISISVSDNGSGISREEQLRIFDKFYRVSTGNLHDVKGFGLGLSYVKSVMDAHGGEVKLDSTPGKGSTFSLVLYES